jgi:hypothetical protein
LQMHHHRESWESAWRSIPGRCSSSTRGRGTT